MYCISCLEIAAIFVHSCNWTIDTQAASLPDEACALIIPSQIKPIKDLELTQKCRICSILEIRFKEIDAIKEGSYYCRLKPKINKSER